MKAFKVDASLLYETSAVMLPEDIVDARKYCIKHGAYDVLEMLGI